MYLYIIMLYYVQTTPRNNAHRRFLCGLLQRVLIYLEIIIIFLLKKCQTPVLAIMIQENAREYNIITYTCRRKVDESASIILLQCSYYILIHYN